MEELQREDTLRASDVDREIMRIRAEVFKQFMKKPSHTYNPTNVRVWLRFGFCPSCLSKESTQALGADLHLFTDSNAVWDRLRPAGIPEIPNLLDAIDWVCEMEEAYVKVPESHRVAKMKLYDVNALGLDLDDEASMSTYLNQDPVVVTDPVTLETKMPWYNG